MLVYCEHRLFSGGESVPVRTLYVKDFDDANAPFLLSRDFTDGTTQDYVHDIETVHLGQDGVADAVLITPFICHFNQGIVFENWGFSKVLEPIDDPYCGECKCACQVEWEHDEDGAGQIEHAPCSDCCNGQLFCDPFMKAEFHPNWEDYDA